MNTIEKNHASVGLLITDPELSEINWGSFYPVLAADSKTIVGVFSAECGEPDGYALDEKLQAYVKNESGNEN